MMKDEYNVIGVMSGTSLDGIDLVYAKFSLTKTWQFEIIHAETVSYTENWYGILKDLLSISPYELQNIDDNYTAYLAKTIKAFIADNNIKNIDSVCSHGHTALHQPEKNITYQIGNKKYLSELLHQTVVCDFRVQDVKFGGQGAPLVPVGDKFLFSEYDFCLNLGGFANISTDVDNHRIAYDVCPVNIVLNYYAEKLGKKYDDQGIIASKGHVNLELLNQLNALHFYKESHPKSLGLEWVNGHVFPLIDSFDLSIEDALKTCVEHIAIQIAKALNNKKESKVLVTGGGVFNSYLVERIKDSTKCLIVQPETDIIDFKEALIFAFLGVLKLRDEVNCLSSVTGASEDHSTGEVFLPKKL